MSAQPLISFSSDGHGYLFRVPELGPNLTAAMVDLADRINDRSLPGDDVILGFAAGLRDELRDGRIGLNIDHAAAYAELEDFVVDGLVAMTREKPVQLGPVTSDEWRPVRCSREPVEAPVVDDDGVTVVGPEHVGRSAFIAAVVVALVLEPQLHARASAAADLLRLEASTTPKWAFSTVVQ
jgi:hypothetical protein